MADTETTAEEMIPSLAEIQSMKVADLKKKLKSFGLPITGNKTELMERLQEAYLSNKDDSFDNSQLTFDESQINELEGGDGGTAIEDSALLDQEQFSSYINSSLEDDSKALDSSERKLNTRSNSVPIAKPLKKRSVSKTAGEGVITEKKVSLNRHTLITHSDFDIKSISNNKPQTLIDDKNEMEEKRVLSVKNMSVAERLAMRAKRFNTSNSALTTNSKSTNSLRNSKQSIISSIPITPDLEVLKKRAERFGQSVSTVMKQIEEKEKLLKRKCKFGANLAISATSSLDEQEKKRLRAERFGIS